MRPERECASVGGQPAPPDGLLCNVTTHVCSPPAATGASCDQDSDCMAADYCGADRIVRCRLRRFYQGLRNVDLQERGLRHRALRRETRHMRQKDARLVLRRQAEGRPQRNTRFARPRKQIFDLVSSRVLDTRAPGGVEPPSPPGVNVEG